MMMMRHFMIAMNTLMIGRVMDRLIRWLKEMMRMIMDLLIRWLKNRMMVDRLIRWLKNRMMLQTILAVHIGVL